MSNLWNELHERALMNNGEDDRAYLANFASRIPRFTTGCKCKEFWTIWYKTNPPVFGPKAEYFVWTVKAHNAVNKKLGKKEYSVEEVLNFYEKK